MIQFSIQGRIGFLIRYGSIHLGSGGVFLFLHSNLSSIVLCVACRIRKGPSFLLALLFSEGWRLGFSKPTGQLSLPASSSRQSMLNPLYLQFAASVDSCPRSGVVHGVVGPLLLLLLAFLCFVESRAEETVGGVSFQPALRPEEERNWRYAVDSVYFCFVLLQFMYIFSLLLF